MIDRLSLDEKIGQMFMGNICGGESVEFARRNFERFHFGALQFSGVFERFVRGGDYLPCGVCRNFPLDEVAQFIFRVKQAGREITGLPVIMAGDQEGSITNSIFRRRNVAIMPSQMGLGAAGSLARAREAASVSALEVKTMGLDMLYGPCLDVLTCPENPEVGARAFGGAPERVAAMGVEFIRAYAAHNVISNVKHFPGRGAGKGDAHRKLEAITLSRKCLETLSLLPFRRAVAEGVDSFMIAHTLYPALEKKRLPASLSRRIITDLLRKEMGFDGVVIPDDLTMFAISQNFGIPTAAAMCLEAGSDMIFMKVPEQYGPSVRRVKRFLREGRLTEERMNESLLRILKLKHQRGLFEAKRFSAERVLATVGSAGHTAVARRAARDAIVVMKNDQRTLPLDPSRVGSLLVIVPRDANVMLSNDPTLSHDMLARALQQRFSNVQLIVTDDAPTICQAYEALGRSKNVDAVIFGVFSTGISPGRLDMMKSILELGKPAIVVNTNSPRWITRLPRGVSAAICTFGLTAFSFEAVADVIAGKVRPTGRLPVRLSREMPQGFGVQLR
jgi:beta-N-acetylhexosaminidase